MKQVAVKTLKTFCQALIGILTVEILTFDKFELMKTIAEILVITAACFFQNFVIYLSKFESGEEVASSS